MAESPPNFFRLDGRVAVVTGGGQSIGRGIAERLASAGARVCVFDLDAGRAADAARAVGGISVPGDVTSEPDIERAINETRANLGPIDILVNNAGIVGKTAVVADLSKQDFEQVLAVNLVGPFLWCRAVVPEMLERSYGRIVNVASITLFGGWEKLLAYVTSKGGVLAFTRALARELGTEGITVNCVSPGAFPTDAEKIHPDPEGYNRFVLESQALKRRGTPEDIGNLVTFLAGDASSFVTGQMVAIDGGWVMH